MLVRGKALEELNRILKLNRSSKRW